MSEESLEIKEFEFPDMFRIGVVDIKPGDTVVLSHPSHISEKVFIMLRDCLKKNLPDNQAILLEEGMSLGVMRNKE